MSDKFTCLSLEKLLTWIKREEKTGTIFGIHKDLFFKPSDADVFRINRYGRVLETPVGVAAGPHTQLSQNIISAWLTGARCIELKTVQVLDELEITKPCIDMEDEGYNCEWSQELKLEESYNEYLNAFIAIHILKKQLKIDKGSETGFIFNMSVGYNMEGILSPGVQKFLDTMTEAGSLLKEKLEIAEKIFPGASDLKIPSTISDNITISTMHGCPPDEIEKIGSYFIEQRKLNTTIKLNPTLLGPDELRDILNNRLGFDITVPDIAFEHDLKYDAGIKLIKNLLKKAKESDVEFNLKLTNTLEAENRKGRLPKKEQMVYMSGRPLHVISINLASKLQKQFSGRLDISFSAGADCFNITDILSCGLKPVTICSDILKPGGYGRVAQYLTEAEKVFRENGADSVSNYIKIKAGIRADENEAILSNLDKYAKRVKTDKKYHKKSFPWSNIKTKRELDAFDCVHAPCRETCPAGQDVPSYMYYTSKGMFEDAFRVIMQTNPFPSVQGMVCDHPCTEKCTRINFDNPLKIREIKRFIAEQYSKNPVLQPFEENGLSVAIIGGGPSGFSASYFLRMNGFLVDVFEAKNFPGGMAADAIPSFRLDDKSIKRDIDRIISLGVNVKYGESVDKEKFNSIRDEYDYVYIAAGALEAYKLDVPGSESKGVFDQLEFLCAIRQGKNIDTGKNIVVIGGGNSAMDAARAAKRLAGEGGKVTILYRRSIREMPADMEEIEDALFEGIIFKEMVAPESVIAENGLVSGIRCLRMEPGEPDDSGRPRPVIVDGSLFETKADTIISAIGQKVVVPFFPEPELKVDPETYKTGLEKVYAGGDAIRGASTLIKAIADGRKAAQSIINDASLSGTPSREIKGYERDFESIQKKIAKRSWGCDLLKTDFSKRSGFDLVTKTLTQDMAIAEASRCLSCDTVCNICTTVCPNRANIPYRVQPFKSKTYKAVCKNGKTSVEEAGTFTISQAHQVINIGDFCNECGNCTTFCPSSGSPYIGKPKFYLLMENFIKEPSGYLITDNLILKREDWSEVSLTEKDRAYIYETKSLTAKIDKESFEVSDVNFKNREDQEVDLKDARELGFLYVSLKDLLPV